MNILKNTLSDKETIVLVTLFSLLIIGFWAFGVFKMKINPLFKFLPFLGILAYVAVRLEFKKNPKD